jgi:hypothetical protein
MRKGEDKITRRFVTKEDEDLWKSIYRTLTEYGGFLQQAAATDELFRLHGRKIYKSKKL